MTSCVLIVLLRVVAVTNTALAGASPSISDLYRSWRDEVLCYLPLEACACYNSAA